MKRLRLTAALVGLLALLAVPALAETSFNSNWNHSYQSDATSVAAASGSFTTMDAEDTGVCVFAAKLSALTAGGTVAFRVEGSVDNSTFLDVSNVSVLSATGTVIFNVGATPKWVRLSWVTGGSPATATATALYSCKR